MCAASRGTAAPRSTCVSSVWSQCKGFIASQVALRSKNDGSAQAAAIRNEAIMATAVVEGIQVPQIELSPNVKKGLSVAGQASALTVKSVSDRTQAGELGRDGRGSRRW